MFSHMKIHFVILFTVFVVKSFEDKENVEA